MFAIRDQNGKRKHNFNERKRDQWRWNMVIPIERDKRADADADANVKRRIIFPDSSTVATNKFCSPSINSIMVNVRLRLSSMP